MAPEGDLRDEGFAREMVAGAAALIHLAPLYPDVPREPEREALDRATRGTYVLMHAAVAAGVRRVVLGSTLGLMEPYPATWAVGEAWQPLPDVTDVSVLAAYLAEESVKQFARIEPLVAICLRLGEIVDGRAVAGRRYDPRWLHVDDAIHAFEKALTALPDQRPPGTTGEARQGWWVFHIPGGGRHTRIPLAAAAGENTLGYAPQQRFEGVPGAGEGAPEPSPADGAC